MRGRPWEGPAVAMVTIAVLIGSFFLVFGAARNPNPENLRPIGTVARVLNAQVWADGHWYALAASNWSGADLVRFVPDDFVPGTKTQQITKGTLVVQHSDGWAILPKDPPH